MRPLLRFAATILIAGSLLAAEAVQADSPLTSASEVRQLSYAAAQRGIPVSLEGVVTYYKPGKIPDLLIQDGNYGLLIRLPDGSGSFTPGERLRIRGRTITNESFAPAIQASELERLGTAPLPAPQDMTRADFSQLEEGRYTELAGVVHSAEEDAALDPPRLLLDLAAEGGRITAWVVAYRKEDAARLVDAEVRVRGVCLHMRNARGQATTRRLVVSSLEDVSVTRPAGPDPFAGPIFQADELLRFSEGGSARHRVRVSGVATCYYPGDVLFLQGESAGLRVRTREQTSVRIGDRVEAAGFAVMGLHVAELEDARIRVLGPGEPPPARRVASRDMRPWELEDQLIEREGVLRDRFHSENGETLALDDGARGFQAVIRTTGRHGSFEKLRLGSRLRVTGVCEGAFDAREALLGIGPNSGRLLLRSPADVTVLQEGPWWTVPRLTAALAACLVIAALAAAWAAGVQRRNRRLASEIDARKRTEQRLEELNWNLEQRVRERSRQLADEIAAREETEVRFAAIAAERSRLALELHDTLEQTLTGAGVQLALLRQTLPPEGTECRERLDLAKEILRQAKVETRRSVWDLHPQSLEDHDLSEALSRIAHQLTEGAVRLEFRSAGTAQRLPHGVEKELLRIGQEAITNSVKHANAQRLEVELQFTDDAIALTVRDDGAGFAPDAAPGMEAGHFGLQGIRERARRINARVEIVSEPGNGARVSVVAAVDAPAPARNGGRLAGLPG